MSILNPSKEMEVYIIFPIISIFLIATAFHDDFLSTAYIVKMGLALSFLIVAAIILIKGINRKKKRE